MQMGPKKGMMSEAQRNVLKLWFNHVTNLIYTGFAVSLQIILSNPKAVFKRRGSQPGMQESDFLKLITTVEELEPKASNCTKVLVSLSCFLRSNINSVIFFSPKTHLIFPPRFLYGTHELKR